MAAAAAMRAGSIAGRARTAVAAGSVGASAATRAAPARGMAVYRDFPKWGIKKQPYIEKNEIRRETKFYSWWPSTKNYAGLVLLAVVFPAFLYTGNRADLVTKATKKRGSKTAQEDYL